MRLSAPVKVAVQRLALPVLVVASTMLILVGKADVLVFDRLRVGLADGIAPLLEAVSRPADTVTGFFRSVADLAQLHRENVQLRDENARLLQWQEAARRLAAENAELRDLVNLVPQNAVSEVSAKVIADAGGAFARNVLVNAGQRDGVGRGQAAMTGEGLVGRVAEVGERTARILLLTDLNSHIPVVLENSHERAVLDGDNSEQPRLLYLPPKTEVTVGERITTGGAGGIFPPGLPVGVVASITGDVVRVEPYAELARLQMIRIVDFGLEGVLPQSAVPAPRAARTTRSRNDDSER
jgi:rod shape-determining protein MreC